MLQGHRSTRRLTASFDRDGSRPPTGTLLTCELAHSHCPVSSTPFRETLKLSRPFLLPCALFDSSISISTFRTWYHGFVHILMASVSFLYNRFEDHAASGPCEVDGQLITMPPRMWYRRPRFRPLESEMALRCKSVLLSVSQPETRRCKLWFTLLQLGGKARPLGAWEVQLG